MPHAPEPAAWLTDNLDLLPPAGRVLDVASGEGRHALFLAERGWRVHAVDRDAQALRALQGRAQEMSLADRVTIEVVDLETGVPPLGHRGYDAVLVFRYLHRPLLPLIVDAVAERGVLVYETFTAAQAERGHPKNPAFLLRPGELPELVSPLRVVRAREGDFEGSLLASVVAVRW